MSNPVDNTPLDISILEEVMSMLNEWRPDDPDVSEDVLKQYDDGVRRLKGLEQGVRDMIRDKEIITRFDMPDTVKKVLVVARRVELVDDADIYALGGNHGKNWNAMVDEIMEYVGARRYLPEERERCSAIVSVVQEHWRAHLPEQGVVATAPSKRPRIPRP
ncbi:hypothetical protein [Thiolapillus sp.]|uniref:hypothetical protein n=7 Tax=Thiolapillus sp. TaxID=2017437 RepID=UPI0025D7593B|nr:hypothetical protein [Thiolapillus sp.]